MRYTPMVLDTDANDIVYEPLARSDNRATFFDCIGTKLDGLLLTHIDMTAARDLPAIQPARL